jgi:hypothetical protein
MIDKTPRSINTGIVSNCMFRKTRCQHLSVHDLDCAVCYFGDYVVVDGDDRVVRQVEITAIRRLSISQPVRFTKCFKSGSRLSFVFTRAIIIAQVGPPRWRRRFEMRAVRRAQHLVGYGWRTRLLCKDETVHAVLSVDSSFQVFVLFPSPH